MNQKRLDNRVIELMRKEEFILEPSLSRRTPDYSQFNILLVDDNQDIINSLAAYLTTLEHFSVVGTASPYIAQELIKSYKANKSAITNKADINPEALIARALMEMEATKEKKRLADNDLRLYQRAGILLPAKKDLQQLYQEGIVVIVSDAKMGGINGFQLLKYAAQEIPDTFRLILSAEIGYTQQRTPEELFAAETIGFVNKGIPDYETALVNKLKHVFCEEVSARNLSLFVKYYRQNVTQF